MSDVPRGSTPVRRVLGYAGGAFLGAVFLVAVWAKVLDPAAFAQTIRAEGLDRLLPASAVAVIALALEAGLGVALVLGLRRRWILLPTLALVLFFVFLTGRTYWRSLHGELPADAGCGCFGNLVQRTPAQAFWQDLLLMVPALLLAFVGRFRGETRNAAAPWRSALVALATVATVLLAWRAPSLPLDDWATRLRPGAEAGSFCAGTGDERVCLDAIVPEAFSGEHVVVLTGLDEAEFLAAIPSLNEHVWSLADPPLWVLSAAPEEDRFQLRFQHGSSFEVYEVPAPLVRPLYRTLPRSFRLNDGRVVETWSGMPPFAGTTATPAAGAGSR